MHSCCWFYLRFFVLEGNFIALDSLRDASAGPMKQTGNGSCFDCDYSLGRFEGSSISAFNTTKSVITGKTNTFVYRIIPPEEGAAHPKNKPRLGAYLNNLSSSDTLNYSFLEISKGS